jgi:hypothetical protein
MYYDMITYFLGIIIRVKMTSKKFSVKKKSMHFSIPRSRSLLNSIEIFIKVTNIARVIQNITRILSHVNLFWKILVQESTFSIHLMDLTLI